MSDTLREVFTLVTIVGPTGEVPPESLYQCEAEEAERLIALEMAINPDQRIVVPQEAMVPADLHMAVVAELDAARVTLAEATSANEEFNAKHGELTAALDASHAEIDRLTKALAAAEKKK
jgi:hypothetical protein